MKHRPSKADFLADSCFFITADFLRNNTVGLKVMTKILL